MYKHVSIAGVTESVVSAVAGVEFIVIIISWVFFVICYIYMKKQKV